MKNLLSVLTLSLVFTLYSCEKFECTDVFLGDFSINATTNAFFPYEEGNTLVFKNQLGEETSFSNISWTKDNFGVVSFFNCGSETKNISYNGDLGSFRFSGNLFDIIMNYTQPYVEEGDPKEENIVDVITFTLVHPNDGFFATMSMVPYTRGVTSYDDLEDFETFQNLSLNGSLYTAGFKSSTGNPDNIVDLYISPALGLIGFTDSDGNTWNFDRKE